MLVEHSKFHKTTLMTTSARTDVKKVGGVLTITGLDPVECKNIVQLRHRISRAEVSQVWTIGGTNNPTIAANAVYKVIINEFDKTHEGMPVGDKTYVYLAPAALSGNAGTDRQNFYNKITDDINADTSIHVTAAAGSGGNSMTLTDDAGYWAARPGKRKGKSRVFLQSSDASLTTATHLELSTAAVYAYGIGADLIANKPVFENSTGNVSTGELKSPTNAVTGQKYAGFIVVSLERTPFTIGNKQAVGYQEKRQLAYVDDGTGTSTTNATGYAATLRAFEKEMYGAYKEDPSASVSMIDQPPAFSGKQTAGGVASTGIPIGATGDENSITFPDATLEHHILGAGQTIIVPHWDTSGLDLVQDIANDEGSEIAASVEDKSPVEGVVGKTPISFRAAISVGDITDLNPFFVGLRKKEAFQADYLDYDEAAGFSIKDATGVTKDIYIQNIFNSTANTADDTLVNWADAEERVFEIRVAVDGTTKFFINDVEYTSVVTTAMVFDAGEVLIPCVYQLAEGAADSGVTVTKWFFVQDILTRTEG